MPLRWSLSPLYVLEVRIQGLLSRGSLALWLSLPNAHTKKAKRGKTFLQWISLAPSLAPSNGLASVSLPPFNKSLAQGAGTL